jgi:hypothetical protein
MANGWLGELIKMNTPAVLLFLIIALSEFAYRQTLPPKLSGVILSTFNDCLIHHTSDSYWPCR